MITDKQGIAWLRSKLKNGKMCVEIESDASTGKIKKISIEGGSIYIDFEVKAEMENGFIFLGKPSSDIGDINQEIVAVRIDMEGIHSLTM